MTAEAGEAVHTMPAEPDEAGPIPLDEVGDLSVRLGRVLDLAASVVADFGESGYADADRPVLAFGPEKVVAEAAMLAHAAAGVGDAQVRSRVDALCRSLAPYARSRRALADVALQPSRAFKYAVPHVLLTVLGHDDPAVDAFFRARCDRALEQGADLPPSARLERDWITGLWGLPVPERGARPSVETLLDRPIDVLSDTREDAYALTHQLFYLTDFGRTRPRPSARSLTDVLDEVEGLVLRYLDAEDYDLTGELLMSWPQLGMPWSSAAAFAFRVLLRVEDQVGVLPCGNVDADRMSRLGERDRQRYARATGYHTAFVMGFLCAVTLRAGRSPSILAGGEPTPSDSVDPATFRSSIEADQGHWIAEFDRATPAEQRVLAPMLANLAVVQKLRQHDYPGLGRVLADAATAGLGDHPLRAAATDRLHALGEAMAAAEVRPG